MYVRDRIFLGRMVEIFDPERVKFRRKIFFYLIQNQSISQFLHVINGVFSESCVFLFCACFILHPVQFLYNNIGILLLLF